MSIVKADTIQIRLSNNFIFITDRGPYYVSKEEALNRYQLFADIPPVDIVYFCKTVCKHINFSIKYTTLCVIYYGGRP